MYTQHDFEVKPVLSSIPELVTPAIADRRTVEIAKEIVAADRDVVLHSVSGSFWTMLYTLDKMDRAWREKRVRAIMFDSCPPHADIYAFGGWSAWFLQAKFGIPARLSKPILSPLFRPVFPYFGIDAAWAEWNRARMFDDELCVVPKSTACLFVRGRNDPVLSPEYVDSYSAFLRARTTSVVASELFDKAQHAMAVVEAPERYKQLHVESLLAMVPEWRA